MTEPIKINKPPIISDEEIKEAGAYHSNPRMILRERLEAQRDADCEWWIEWLKKHNDFNECGTHRKGARLLLTIKHWQELQKLGEE